jgi:hypothetical protein
MVEQKLTSVLSLFFHFISSLGQWRVSAKTHAASVIRRRATNSFNSEMPGESRWHSHRGGQFFIAESGISHLRTEFGAWIICAPAMVSGTFRNIQLI